MKRTSKRQWLTRIFLSLVFVLGCAFFCLTGTQAYFKKTLETQFFNLRISRTVTEITLSETTLLLPKGRTHYLTATITPADAYETEIIWKSSSNGVVTVTDKGKITAVGEGTATITATIQTYNEHHGYYITAAQAQCTVTVGKAVESISLDKSIIHFTEAGQTQTLTATITPADAQIKDVDWLSTDASVAKIVGTPTVVASTTGTATITVQAVAAGRTSVKAIAKDGMDYAECLVQFEEDVTTYLDCMNLSTDCDVTLPTVLDGTAVTWTSSNEAIASVEADGSILTKKQGTVTFTASNGTSSTAFVLGDQTTFKNHYYTPEGNFVFPVFHLQQVKFNGTPLSEDEYTYGSNNCSISKATLAGKTTTKNNVLTFISAQSLTASVNIRILEAEFTSFEWGELGAEVINPLSGVGEPTLTGDTGNRSISLPITETRQNHHATFGLHPDYVRAMFSIPSLVGLDIQGNLRNLTGEVQVGYFGVAPDGTWDALTDTSDSGTFHITLNRADYNYFKENDTNWESNIDVNVEGIYNTSGNGEFEIEKIVANWETGGAGNPNLVRRVFFDLQVSQGEGFTLPLSTKDGYTASKSWQTLDDYSTTIDERILDQTESSWNIANTSHPRYDKEYVFVTSRVIAEKSQFVLVGNGITGSYTYTPYSNSETYSLRVTDATLNGVNIVGGGVSGVTITATGVRFSKATLANMLGHNRLEMRVERTQTIWNQLYTTVDYYCVTVCAVTQKDYDDMANAVTFENGRLSPFMCVLNAYSEVVDSTVMNRSNFNYANEASYVMPDGTTRQNEKVLKVTTKRDLSPRIAFARDYIVARYEALRAEGLLDGRAESAYLFRATMYGVYNDSFSYQTYWASTLNVSDEHLVWSGSDSQNSTQCVKPLTLLSHFTDHYTAGTGNAAGTLDESYLVLQLFSKLDSENVYFDNFFNSTNTLYLNSDDMRANSYLVMPD